MATPRARRTSGSSRRASERPRGSHRASKADAGAGQGLPGGVTRWPSLASGDRPIEPRSLVLPPGRIPIGVALGSIGVSFAWWSESARRLEAAGYAGVWCWDHFVSRGRRSDPVLEAWTTLSAVGALTTTLTVGPFVANVMNRHPAVLARMAATLQEVTGGRLVLGVGIGGHPAEHDAYGIPFPPAPERALRLREAIAVLRALWTGGPIDRPSPFYPLRGAVARPAPVPPPPIIVGAATAAGVRLAAELGDGWTTPAERFDGLVPLWRQATGRAGRKDTGLLVLVAFGGGRAGEPALAGSPWIEDPATELARWRTRGADGVIVTARTTTDVDALVAAADRYRAATGP